MHNGWAMIPLRSQAEKNRSTEQQQWIIAVLSLKS